MANRILKRIDYLELLTLIFKFSKYDKNRATILVKYISFQLLKQGFNQIYIDKLQLDTDMTLEPLPYNNRCIEAIQNEIDLEFEHIEIVEIKSFVFDTLQKGYYS